jgi:AraC-like DNA-binding protein
MMIRTYNRIEYKIPVVNNEVTINSQLSFKFPKIQEFAQPLYDIGLHSITMLRKRRNIKNKLQRTNCHLLLLVLKGEMNMQLGKTKMLLKPGMLSFCPNDQTFSVEAKGPVWWISINLHDTPKWEPLKQHGTYFRDYESSDYMLLLLTRIFEAHQNQSVDDKLNALEDSRSLADLIKREIRIVAEPPHTRGDKLNQLVEKIQLAPQDPWTVTKMAKIVHLSPRSLNRLFHHEYGMGPMDFVITKRLDNAIEMLIYTSDKIEDIAGSLNYKSVYSFSNLFLRHIGMRPGAFRSKYITEK